MHISTDLHFSFPGSLTRENRKNHQFKTPSPIVIIGPSFLYVRGVTWQDEMGEYHKSEEKGHSI
jgi:hypothetical protein